MFETNYAQICLKNSKKLYNNRKKEKALRDKEINIILNNGSIFNLNNKNILFVICCFLIFFFYKTL